MRGLGLVTTAVATLALAACSTSAPQPTSAKRTATKEYFAESEYGVKASPRVSMKRSGLPRGGGREQVGKPYKVKGKWYHPKEDPAYRNAGMASWYGDAFHGRLTANGEIYDMTHLTAAHPTMPLPSYARVTNRANGSSVIVRVNDRGPFAHGRIIDLSRRAAELLDYTQKGVAKVDVEYVGRAPLHGQDDAFLMASYRPGGVGPDPSDGLPTGVMIAMNGPTPTISAAAAPVFPGQQVVQEPVAAAAGDPILPAFGPIAPERPGVGLARRLGAEQASQALAYADERVKRAAQVVSDFAGNAPDNAALVAALNRRYVAAPAATDYVAVGTYASQAEAEAMARSLASAGDAKIEADWSGDGFVVSLRSDGRLSTDNLLKAAWAAGASDAMTVRE